MRFVLLLTLSIAAISAQSMRDREEQRNPLAGQKAAIEAGARRFREGCAACHGADAQGGRGPRLVKNRDLYRFGDQELFQIVQRGIPGTSMPPSQLPDTETWQVVAFVRSLSSPASQAFVEGDAAHGRELFFGAGHCDSCHSILGKGGLLGPDLSDAGVQLTVGEIKESLENPSVSIDPAFRGVSIHLRDGSVVEGISKSDSTYSLDVLDRNGKLHLIDKSTVRSIDWAKNSLMPGNLTQQLGPAGVNDLVAFLAGQVIRPNIGDTPPQRRRRRGIQ